MGTVRRMVTSAVLSVGLLFVFAPFVLAAAVPPKVQTSPASGPAGSGFTITWSAFGLCASAGTVQFTWAGTDLVKGTGAAGSVGATVPSGATVGSYVVGGVCVSANGASQSASATFRVTPTVITTTPPPPPPPTTVRTIPPPPPPTTRKPVITPPKTTTTAPPSPTTTTPPPPTTAPPTATTTTPPTGGLLLDHGTIRPGDPLVATGTGCTPGRAVSLTSDGAKVGSAVADADGRFTASVVFTRIDPGSRMITADCGVVLTGEVTQVLTSSVGDNSGTLIVLVFFVLAGVVLVRFV